MSFLNSGIHFFTLSFQSSSVQSTTTPITAAATLSGRGYIDFSVRGNVFVVFLKDNAIVSDYTD